MRKRLAMGAATLFLTSGSLIAAYSVPAHAGLIVYNMMLCEPDTGWCYQTNPPYNPSVPHECQWDYKLNGHNLRSGMWYTGCNVWWPQIN
jgi:hypothetical protein